MRLSTVQYSTLQIFLRSAFTHVRNSLVTFNDQRRLILRG